MASLRLKLPGAVALFLLVGIGILVLAADLLMEPWFAQRSRSGFEDLRDAMLAEGTVRAGPGGDEELARRAKMVAGGSSYKVEVADREGMVVASSVPEFVPGQRFPLTREEGGFLAEHLRRLERGDSFYGILASSEPDKSTLHLVTGLGGGRFLVVSQPLARLRQAMALAADFFLVFGSLVLALEAAFALLLAGRLVKPIMDLSGVAGRFAAGDLEARWGGSRTDELGTLGASLDGMAERLASTVGQLARANAALESKVKAQEDFMAGASHELKTPVGLVRGYAEALRLGYYGSDEERDELADIIQKEADRLDRLVRDLAFVAMSDGAGLSLLRASGDLGAVAAEAVSRFSLEAESRGARLELSRGADLDGTFDAHRLLQALDNLLSNAFRHVRKGGLVLVRARREEDSGSGERLVLEVENEGEPIPEAALPRLFEPFYRVDAARDRASGGSGLGLALVKRVAEAHGGSCGVGNTKEGVKAWISFPAAPAGFRSP